MSPALIKAGTAITALIRSCLVDKRIDPADMIAGDRNALVFAIRITGYGHEYDATVECPECDEDFGEVVAGMDWYYGEGN